MKIPGLIQRGKIWWYRYTSNGRRYQMSTGETDKLKAIAFAEQVRENALKYEEQGGNGLRIEDAIESYLASMKQRGLSPRHIRENQYSLERWQREIGLDLMSEVTGERLQKWFDHKIENGGVKVSTAHMYLECVRLLFEHAPRLKANPALDVIVPKFHRTPRDVWFNESEMNVLLENCLDRELKYCLYCGFHAGLRYEEVIMSRPEWFDLQRGTLSIRFETTPSGWKPKDREQRTIPLTTEFLEFLRTDYALRGPYMIAPKVVQGLNKYRFEFKNRFYRYINGQGFSGYTFHDLRRSFASQRVSAGVSIYKVAKWLGDGVQVVEKHYGHLAPIDNDINLPGASKVVPMPVEHRAL